MKKVLFILCCLFFVNIYNVQAEEQVMMWEEKENIAEHHTFKIQLEAAINPKTLTSTAVYVTLGDLKIEGIELTTENNHKTVVVKAPVQGYIAGETYILHITRDLKTAKGGALKKAVQMPFTIAFEERKIVEISDNVVTQPAYIASRITNVTEKEIYFRAQTDLVGIEAGQILDIPSFNQYKNGLIAKVVKVDTTSEKPVIHYTEPAFEEVFEQVDIQQQMALDPKKIELAPGITIDNSIGKQASLAMPARPADIVFNINRTVTTKLGVVNEYVTLSKVDAFPTLHLNGQMAIHLPKITVDISKKPAKDVTALSLLPADTIKFGITGGISSDLTLTFEKEKDFELTDNEMVGAIFDIKLFEYPLTALPKPFLGKLVYSYRTTVDGKGTVVVNFEADQLLSVSVGSTIQSLVPLKLDDYILNNSGAEYDATVSRLTGELNMRTGFSLASTISYYQLPIVEPRVFAGLKTDVTLDVQRTTEKMVCTKLDLNIFGQVSVEFPLPGFQSLDEVIEGETELKTIQKCRDNVEPDEIATPQLIKTTRLSGLRKNILDTDHNHIYTLDQTGNLMKTSIDGYQIAALDELFKIGGASFVEVDADNNVYINTSSQTKLRKYNEDLEFVWEIDKGYIGQLRMFDNELYAIVQDDDGKYRIVNLDKKNYQEKRSWPLEVELGYVDYYVIDNSLIVLYDEVMKSYNTAKKVNWETKVKPRRFAELVINNGQIYINSYFFKEFINAYNLKSGEHLWEYETNSFIYEEDYAIKIAPNGLLYYNFNGNILIINELSKTKGMIFTNHYNYPVDFDQNGNVYIVTRGTYNAPPKLMVYTPDHQLLWEYEFENSTDIIGSARPLSGDVVLVPTRDGYKWIKAPVN